MEFQIISRSVGRFEKDVRERRLQIPRAVVVILARDTELAPLCDVS